MMMSPVTKAMVEAYALMIMVMGTFFLYFCGMVWAFCNPVVSGGEEEDMVPDAPDLWQISPHSQEGFRTSACPAREQHARDWLAQTTYVNFGGDTDTLLVDRNGFADHVRESKNIRGSPV